MDDGYTAVDPPDADPYSHRMREAPATVRARLLEWYRAHRRNLPWRKNRDPYRVWVSEIMLQQTRVDTVIPYFEAFVERWPSVSALASADPEEVRARWSGLGYYRRARLMLDAARVIAERHGGRFPETAEGLAALPGFGRYTAGAVASIAFDAPAAAVDGNVSRVLARLEGIEGDLTRGEPSRSVWTLAEALATAGEEPGTAGDHTQAVIELGALVCTPKRPKCLLCPVASACTAQAEGTVDRIPSPRPKPTRKRIDLSALIWNAEDRVVLAQQSPDGLFAGLWTPPWVDGHVDDLTVLAEARRLFGRTFEGVESVGVVKHVLTHRDLHLQLVRLQGAASPVGAPLRWCALAELDALGVPSLTTKILRRALPSALLNGVTLPGRQTSRPS